MISVNDALHAGLRPLPPTAATTPGRVVVVGGAGALGAAVLEQLLGAGSGGTVAALVSRPVAVALRGLATWTVPTLAQLPTASQQADSAVVVFDRARGRHGREAAFLAPGPDQLPQLGRWLMAAGVQRLVVVMPHAPTLMPQALRAGLATLDEQALASLGLLQLVIVRPARGPGGGAQVTGPWLERLGRGLLAQLSWMVPQREQPLRPLRVAQFVNCLLRALPAATPGTRVAPPELLWDWAQPAGGDGMLHDWLRGARWTSPPASGRRW